MTVGELREIIKDLPDDMIVATLDEGLLTWEYVGARVVTDDDPLVGVPSLADTPPRPFCLIS